MNVYQVRLLLSKQFSEVLPYVLSPNGSSYQLDSSETRIISGVPVAPAICENDVPEGLQQLKLLFKYDILTAGLLIRVMYEQNFHLQPGPFRRTGATNGSSNNLTTELEERYLELGISHERLTEDASLEVLPAGVTPQS